MVAVGRFGPRVDWRAARRRSGVELRCPIRWLKSPTTTRRAPGARFSNLARPARYSSWSCHILWFQGVDPPASGIRDKQTPMIVTSPTSVWVMPDTNRPGGSAAWPNHPRPPRALWTTAGPSVCPPVPSGRVASSWPGRRWSGHPGQHQTRGVRLGETDDVRSVLGNAALQLRRFPLGRGPFGIPVEQFQRHGASPVGSMNAATWVNCGPYIGGTLVVYDCKTTNLVR